MSSWKSALVCLALCIISNESDAMDTIELTCDACHFKVTLNDGPTKRQYVKEGAWNSVFFCTATHTFVSLQAVGSKELYEKSGHSSTGAVPAVKTDIPVSTGSQYWLYTHPSCPKQLVPLGYYRNENPACPVCLKGTLELKTIRFTD